MAFERNDIVNKTRLMGELGEELMGYEHNDIVTVDVMNKAIAEGGGGGGGGDYNTATVTIVPQNGSNFGLSIVADDNGNYAGVFVYENEYGNTFTSSPQISSTAVETTLMYLGDSVEVYPATVATEITGSAVYDENTGKITITGDCSITGYVDD